MNTNYKKSFGAIASPPDVRDYRIATAINSAEFPDEFELTPPAIKNQGSVGSCVAHALSEVIEYHNSKQEGTTVKMSTGYIYGNRRNSTYQREGMIVRDALGVINKYGDVPNTLFAYNIEIPNAITTLESSLIDLFPSGYPNRITSYYRCTTANEIKKALTAYGPVAFAMSWYSDIYVDKTTGIMHTAADPNTAEGGHCMMIYGWTKDGWRIQNSWGTSWGIDGRAILPYTVPISEAWGVIDEISERGRLQKIAELQQSVSALTTEVETLRKSKEALLEQIQTLQLDNVDDEEIKKSLQTLMIEYENIKQQYDESIQKITEQQEEIKKLNENLIELQKPWNTALGRIFAKIVNFILSIIDKLNKKKS